MLQCVAVCCRVTRDLSENSLSHALYICVSVMHLITHDHVSRSNDFDQDICITRSTDCFPYTVVQTRHVWYSYSLY